MSNSVVQITVWTTVGVWAVLILAVIIQSILGVTVGMSVVAIGAAMAIGRWGSRWRAASGND